MHDVRAHLHYFPYHFRASIRNYRRDEFTILRQSLKFDYVKRGVNRHWAIHAGGEIIVEFRVYRSRNASNGRTMAFIVPKQQLDAMASGDSDGQIGSAIFSAICRWVRNDRAHTRPLQQPFFVDDARLKRRGTISRKWEATE